MSLAIAAAAALLVSDASAQARGLVGLGLGVPVGDLADENIGAAESGGGTALLGFEWLPAGQRIGVRVDGAWNRFCTTLCDEGAGNFDIRYRFLNANLNGVIEFPAGDGMFRPYVIAGVGLYNYKLEGEDVPAGADESETDFGLNGGLGVMYKFGRLGAYAEGRFHNVLAEGSDLQYIPIMVGVKLDLQ